MEKSFVAKSLLYLSFNNEYLYFNNTAIYAPQPYYLFCALRGSYQFVIDKTAYTLNCGEYLMSDLPAQNFAESTTDTCEIIRIKFTTMDNLAARYLYQSMAASQTILDLLKTIVEESVNKHPGYLNLMICNLTAILTHTLRTHYISAPAENVRHDVIPSNDSTLRKNLMRDCLSLIEKNIASPDLNVAFLTARLFVSPAYLHRLFHQHMHTSINQYIQNLRMEKARQYLLKSPLSVTEIAESLGFCSQSYFSTQFKRKHGVSPSEYRNAKNG